MLVNGKSARKFAAAKRHRRPMIVPFGTPVHASLRSRDHLLGAGSKRDSNEKITRRAAPPASDDRSSMRARNRSLNVNLVLRSIPIGDG